MAENFLAKQYTRIFSETYIERRRGNGGWMHFAPKGRTPVDFQINRWANEKNVLLLDVKLTTDQTDPRLVKEGTTDVWERTISYQYVILYRPLTPEAFEYEHVATEEEKALPMPMKDGALAPTVEITAVEGGTSRPAYAMAGVFGVPEGFKFATDDDEPAPLPLFSPDLDLKVYGKLFGNVGGVDVKPANSK